MLPNCVLWRQISVGSSVWDLRRVTLLEPRILKWFLDLWKILVPLYGTRLKSKLVSVSCLYSQQLSRCRIFHDSLSKPFCSGIRCSGFHWNCLDCFHISQHILQTIASAFLVIECYCNLFKDAAIGLACMPPNMG